MLSRNLFFCILIILHYPNEYCAYHTNYVRVFYSQTFHGRFWVHN